MDVAEAYETLGHQSHYELVGLVKSLSHHPWQNKPEDERRRQAAIWALKNPYAWSRECRLRREGVTGRNLWTAAQLREFSK